MGGVEAVSSAVSARQSMDAIDARSGGVSNDQVVFDTSGPALQAAQSGSVTFEASGNTIGSDFSKVLDTYRAKTDKIDTAVASARAGGSNEPISQQQMLRQLTELYAYAVDTQLMVKTSGQLTQGFRQLVTGQ
jgi:hypothetical protein